MGLYSLILFFLGALLIYCGILKEQYFALWTFMAGIAILLFWYITPHFETYFHYKAFGIDRIFIDISNSKPGIRI